ncbi:MAG: tRNA lysidine(34) synthetase TilS [Thiotrichales bacterium]|nr:tRNA lysidine(34) synthetase TilS [Thiotrichales bacterium]
MDRLDQTPFAPDLVTEFAAAFPPGSRFVIAFSGGADSLALLHAFAGSRERDSSMRLCAVHVDHHLHPDSTRWARQCRDICHRLAIELTVLDADLRPDDAAHVNEGTARAARYAVFERILSAGDVLCTAHSRDDHIETVLLNLLRGGGARGLAGIPARRRLGPGTVARPALGVSRAALHAYARGTGLESIRDPANEDPRFSRVLLRRKVIPTLEERWPTLRSTLARAAERGRESADLLDTLAAIDLEPAGGIDGESLDVAAVGALDPARRRNAVAGWLRARGITSPGARRIEQIARNLVEARRDAMPCIGLGNVEVRRFRGRIRLISRATPVAAQVVRGWRIPEPLALDHGCLAWKSCTGGGLDDAVGDTRITVRVRGDDAGWMRATAGRGRSLKKRFQSLGIPPWERRRIPLVYSDDMLAAIGSAWINPRLAARPGASGWRVLWTPRR